MRPYRFSMDRILEWREVLEKDHKDRLARKKHQIDIKNMELDELLKEYDKAKSNTRVFRNVQDLTQSQLYRQRLSDQIKEKRGYLTRLENELEETRKELVQARRDKLAMEKLKEKDKEKYDEKVKQKEQEFLDEISSTRYSRQDD